MRKKRIRAFRLIPAALCVSFFIYALFAFPSQISFGIQEGLLLCGQVIIPSLFPFVAAALFISKSGLAGALGRILLPVTRTLFHLPGSAACVILMSLVGGYPVGAKMTADLYEKKEISREEAQRMMLFCVNAGPAFIISAIGGILLRSTASGVILFASTILSSLTIGIVSGILHRKDEITSCPPKRPDQSGGILDSYVQSVTEAASAMFSVCAWIVFFSAVVELFRLLPVSENTAMILSCLMEVVAGCTAAAKVMGLPFLAAVLCWSGLSVQCQILPILLKAGLKPLRFLIGRIIGAILAFFYCHILLQIFPQELSVFSSGVLPLPALTSATVPAAAGMLLMSVFLILEVEPGQKI